MTIRPKLVLESCSFRFSCQLSIFRPDSGFERCGRQCDTGGDYPQCCHNRHNHRRHGEQGRQVLR